MGRRIRFWMGTLGPQVFQEDKLGSQIPFRFQISDTAGNFQEEPRLRSGRPPRGTQYVAAASSETQTDQGEEQIATQGEVTNGALSNYHNAHRFALATLSLSPAP